MATRINYSFGPVFIILFLFPSLMIWDVEVMLLSSTVWFRTKIQSSINTKQARKLEIGQILSLNRNNLVSSHICSQVFIASLTFASLTYILLLTTVLLIDFLSTAVYKPRFDTTVTTHAKITDVWTALKDCLM